MSQQALSPRDEPHYLCEGFDPSYSRHLRVTLANNDVAVDCSAAGVFTVRWARGVQRLVSTCLDAARCEAAIFVDLQLRGLPRTVALDMARSYCRLRTNEGQYEVRGRPVFLSLEGGYVPCNDNWLRHLHQQEGNAPP